MDQGNPLYAYWFGALPRLFAAMAPVGEKADAELSRKPPFPVGEVTEALARFGETLAAVYRGYLDLLGKNGEADVLPVLMRMQADSLRPFGFAAATGGEPPIEAGGPAAALAARLWAPWLGPSADSEGAAPHALRIGIERTFGGLADAFGLAPSRELADAWSEMAGALAAKQRAQAELLGVYSRAWAKGAESLLAKLAEMGQRGESVDSLLALIRLSARAMDEATHAAMQSEAGLRASAGMIRAATRYRAQVQRAVAIASGLLDVPTRAEVDEAYREIQELKRELRRLRKPQAAAAGTPPAGSARGARRAEAVSPPAEPPPRRAVGAAVSGAAAGRVRATRKAAGRKGRTR